MDKAIVSYFKFVDYKISNIEYKENSLFKDDGKGIEIDLNLSTNISITEDNKNAKIQLGASIFNKAEENNYPFFLHIDLEGYFEMESDSSQQELLNFCKINGTTALFPYLRAAVSDVTRLCNTKVLILPLINVYKLIQNEEEQLK